ncbi:MAG: aldehyde dehydrogenase family protein [Phycisphaerales bacterium JB039]
MGRFCGSATSPTGGAAIFRVTNPLTGAEMATEFQSISAGDLDRACWKAWEAFHAMRDRSHIDRAGLLDAIATRIAGLGDALTSIACAETGLSAVKVVGERERVVGNLHELAARLRAGAWLSAHIEPAEPSRRPTPKPDLRSMRIGLGPVLALGCGPAPLLTGPAGTDAACALAAGCPVICKSHPERAATDEMVAWAIVQALEAEGFHPATIALLHAGGAREGAIVERLVKHSCVRAVTMAGARESVEFVGRLCALRPDPIPLFAIIGSTNPVFALPGAVGASQEDLANRLFSAVTSTGGQSCLRPGLLFLERGGESEGLLQRLGVAFNAARPQPMVSRRARRRYGARLAEVMRLSGVDLIGGSVQADHGADPGGAETGPVMASCALLRTSLSVFKKSALLHEQISGPALVVIMCRDGAEMVEGAGALQGSLSGTIWLATRDAPTARRLTSALERRVGRIIFNGTSLGLEFTPASVHTGPFPAATRAELSAYGPDAPLRFLRPVCYQNAPDALLPRELRAANPLGVRRRRNGLIEPAPRPAEAA